MSVQDPLAAYAFDFPRTLIANAPASPRDSSRLMVCRRGKDPVAETTFGRLAEHLPPRAVLVFNETRVVPARLEVGRATGGRVRLLILGRDGRRIMALADRALRDGETLSLRPGYGFSVVSRDGSTYALHPTFKVTELDRIMERFGSTPIPPYIKDSPLSEKELRRRYQSVFASRRGSVAAPTASLHFTPRLLAQLKRRGFDAVFVTLHVGLGTFAPLTTHHLATGILHKERFAVGAKTAMLLNRAKREGRPIITVGTTALRALESAADTRGRIRARSGTTSLFIRDGYRFKAVGGLITNFHVPHSSLLMLVSAFAGRDAIMRCYRRAVRERYRLFSFGDAMLII